MGVVVETPLATEGQCLDNNLATPLDPSSAFLLVHSCCPFPGLLLLFPVSLSTIHSSEFVTEHDTAKMSEYNHPHTYCVLPKAF